MGRWPEHQGTHSTFSSAQRITARISSMARWMMSGSTIARSPKRKLSNSIGIATVEPETRTPIFGRFPASSPSRPSSSTINPGSLARVPKRHSRLTRYVNDHVAAARFASASMDSRLESMAGALVASRGFGNPCDDQSILHQPRVRATRLSEPRLGISVTLFSVLSTLVGVSIIKI